MNMCSECSQDAGINELCLNKNNVCGPHRDGRNSSTHSYICFFGKYTSGGELMLEDGRVLSEKRIWHCFDGRRLLHWNTKQSKPERRIQTALGSSRGHLCIGSCLLGSTTDSFYLWVSLSFSTWTGRGLPTLNTTEGRQQLESYHFGVVTSD